MMAEGGLVTLGAARVALPPARRGGRAAPGADREGLRPGAGQACRSLRARRSARGDCAARRRNFRRPAEPVATGSCSLPRVSSTSTWSSPRSSAACRSTGSCSRRSATTSISEIEGERGETIWYLSGPGVAIGLREAQSERRARPLQRGPPPHRVRGLVRATVDERAAWLVDQGAEIESGPEGYGYQPGYYAVFFYDPDGIKLEIVHIPPTRQPEKGDTP